MAIPVRIDFAGSTAFTSVYVRPVMMPSSEVASANLSNQYAIAFIATIAPRRIDSCTRAVTVVRSSRTCGRIPP